MATVNLGRIKPTWQGTWDSGTQYVADDIVYYNNSAWVAVATSTNSAPSGGNANWELMAQGADIPSDATTGQILTATGASTFAWDDLPPSDDASALTTGTLSADRMPAGTVVGVQRVTNSSRVSWSTSGNYTYWTGSINKQYSSSILIAEVRLSMRDNYSDVLMHEMEVGNSGWVLSTMAYNAGFSANSRPASMRYWITGCTNTGSQSFAMRWRTNNGASGDRPANIWNPNSGDDSRHSQEFSEIVVWEIAQ